SSDDPLPGRERFPAAAGRKQKCPLAHLARVRASPLERIEISFAKTGLLQTWQKNGSTDGFRCHPAISRVGRASRGEKDVFDPAVDIMRLPGQRGPCRIRGDERRPNRPEQTFLVFIGSKISIQPTQLVPNGVQSLTEIPRTWNASEGPNDGEIPRRST